MAIRAPIEWSQLLRDAVTQPGRLSEAYQRFWNYSFGNALLALFQCHARGIEPGPIHTFKGWLELGRHVKKGERAIVLCMPIKIARKAKDIESNAPDGGDGAERKAAGIVTRFVYRNHWFVLSQTEGAEYVPTVLPDWNERDALDQLFIERAPFRHSNGNTQGYAVDRQVAISPVAALPQKTLFHEMAHVVLGHTEELRRMDDHEATPVNLREVEAECVALICCESLKLPGIECSRGYIQHWLAGEQIPERSAQRIFKAADAILRAGRPTTQTASNPDCAVT